MYVLFLQEHVAKYNNYSTSDGENTDDMDQQDAHKET